MMTTMNMTLLTEDGTMMMINGTKTLPLMSLHLKTPTLLILQTPPRPLTRLIKKRATNQMTQITKT